MASIHANGRLDNLGMSGVESRLMSSLFGVDENVGGMQRRLLTAVFIPAPLS